MAQLPCIGLSWPLTNRHLLGVASHLLSLRCNLIYNWIRGPPCILTHLYGAVPFINIWGHPLDVSAPDSRCVCHSQWSPGASGWYNAFNAVLGGSSQDLDTWLITLNRVLGPSLHDFWPFMMAYTWPLYMGVILLLTNWDDPPRTTSANPCCWACWYIQHSALLAMVNVQYILRAICLVHHSLLPPTNHCLIITHFLNVSQCMVYLPTFGEFLYKNVRKYTIHRVSGLCFLHNVLLT